MIQKNITISRWRQHLLYRFVLIRASSDSRLRNIAGSTLIEQLVIVLFLGVLSALSSISLQGILQREKLRSGTVELQQTIQLAQSNSLRDKRSWQVQFRQGVDTAFWIMTSSNQTPPTFPTSWQSLPTGVEIDSTNSNLNLVAQAYSIEFDAFGTIDRQNQQARLTLKSENNPDLKRCVIIDSALGSVRIGTKQDTPVTINGQSFDCD